MSQSATLYRLTKQNFHKIEKLEAKHVNPSEVADGNLTFQGSFMGLEFILSKGITKDYVELISEIFNPIHFIGPTDTNIFNLDSEEEFWDTESAAGYLTATKVKKLSALLNTIEESSISDNFDAAELNENQIYPGCWHDGEGTKFAFSRGQILLDFQSLRNFFRNAAESDNYLLSYVG